MLAQLIACSDTPMDSETNSQSSGDSTEQEAETPAEEGTETDDSVDEDESVSSPSGRNVTFLPLSIFETSKDYSLLSKENVHITESYFPFIHGVMLSVHNAETLAIDTGTVDDFVIREDEQVVDPLESFPVLQTVGAIPTYLHTAIVIDVSGSVRNSPAGNPLPEAVSEAKAIIAQAQASTDPVIKNQRFTIWAFGKKVKELTPNGFTEDSTILNTALDEVLNSNLYDDLDSPSSLNLAIVQAIGRYDGQGASNDPTAYTFRDDGTVGNTNNDLIEGVSTERIQLSSLIVITSGAADQKFTDEQVKIAIESQSQVIFKTESDEEDTANEEVIIGEDGESDSEAPAGAESEVTKNLGKPFIAVLVGNSTRVQASITDNANHIIDLRGKSDSEISFASTVLGYQTSLINFRKREGDRYLLRYASVYRSGKHESLITTGAVDTSYSLTGEIDIPTEIDINMPSGVYIPGVFSSVEITGPSDQYLQRSVNVNNTNVFYPTTRWTSAVYSASDYTWELDGNALAADPVTGAVSITAADLDVSGVSTLSLTNLALSETTSMQLTASLSPIIQMFESGLRRILGGQSLPQAELNYIDRNANVVTDPNAPPPAVELVYQIEYEDFNAPLESYNYNVDIDVLTESTDYDLVSNGIQIHKSSIDSITTGNIVITVDNLTLGTSAGFTITQ